MKFTEHLKKNRDFQVVYRNGKSWGSKTLVMYCLKNDKDVNRLGISVSKKVGNSVVRHHLTRLIRESYRLNEDKFENGLDIIVVCRPGAKECSFFDIERTLLYLAGKQKIKKEVIKSEDNTD